MSRWPALVIEHERPTPAGLIEPWLEERGAEVHLLRIDEEYPRDLDPREFGLIVSLGSEFPAYKDDLEWISHEIDLFRGAVEADVPILGVCFGGQLLARVLGGEVFRSDREEIGWLPLTTRSPELVPEGRWFQWHFDTFTLPPGAHLLAESDVGPQAFVAGRSLGVQFHPEITTEIMERWVDVYRHELDDSGVDPDRLLAETYELADSANARSRTLLDAFLERIARPQERV